MASGRRLTSGLFKLLSLSAIVLLIELISSDCFFDSVVIGLSFQYFPLIQLLASLDVLLRIMKGGIDLRPAMLC